MTVDGARQLARGARVQLRNQFDGSWSSGFELCATAEDGGYRVRRLSDHSMLPVTFAAADVRPEGGVLDVISLAGEPAGAAGEPTPVRPAAGEPRLLTTTAE